MHLSWKYFRHDFVKNAQISTHSTASTEHNHPPPPFPFLSPQTSFHPFHISTRMLPFTINFLQDQRFVNVASDISTVHECRKMLNFVPRQKILRSCIIYI